MPRVRESIDEINEVKSQVDENCREHARQMKQTRKAVRKQCKAAIREGEKSVAEGEKKKMIATMSKLMMERVVQEIRK